MRCSIIQSVAPVLVTSLLLGCGAAPMQGEAPSGRAYNPDSAAPMSPAPMASPDAPAEEMALAQAAPMKPGQVAQPTSIAPAAPPPPPGGVAMPATAKAADIAVATPEPQGTEDYKDYGVNPITDPAKDRFSTFAIDVDTASYSIARRKLVEGALPPFQAVRAEEFLNYFDYGYAAPKSGPFAVHLAAAPSPFTTGHHVLRVAVQGKRIAPKDRSPVHLVYLVDTSGSMQAADKMGLVKQSLKLLTESLKAGDSVALCTYAGSVREVLAPTGIEKKAKILTAIDDLTASGSTAMSSGIELAYNLAERTLVKGHINRVVVLSDGDANVGPTSHEEILKTIKRSKDKGITLSTVGFGQGNYKDTMMERLANEGDGNYYYIDSDVQARRVFSDQVNGMLEVIAKDVKIQVEFDPNVVKTYRLIGYENRDVADKDFRNDKVDAGEIGAGHSVTAVYDVELKNTTTAPVVVRLRHKPPLGSDKAIETLVKMETSAIAKSFESATPDFRFATAVAGFAEILRQSPHAASWNIQQIESLARASANQSGEQQEFISLVKRAVALKAGKPNATVAK